MEKSAKEGTRNRDQLICILRNPIKSTKPDAIVYVYRTWYRLVQALCMLPQATGSLSSYMLVGLCLEDLVFWVFSIPFGSYYLYASSFLEPWGQEFVGGIPFWTLCYVTRSLNPLLTVHLWVSVFVLIYRTGKLLWRWLSKSLIYVYSKMSLRSLLIATFL